MLEGERVDLRGVLHRLQAGHGVGQLHGCVCGRELRLLRRTNRVHPVLCRVGHSKRLLE